jgi:hypothetical protein
MIEINLNTARFKLEIRGHAKPEEHPDYSAICTGVSTLAQGLGYTISKYESDHEALNGLDYRPEAGDLLLKAYPASWAEAAIRKRYNAYGDGLELMALSHPECIRMIRDGEEIKAMEEEKES